MTLHVERSAWEKDRAHLLHPYTNFESFKETGSHMIEAAEGMYVRDNEGRTLLDGIAGLWCVNIGHGRAEMAEAIADQVKKMAYYNPFGHSSNVPAAELGAWLAAHAPGDLNHVYYTCGGSTANDAAIRIARYYHAMRDCPAKRKIISRVNGYHGGTSLTAALTGIHATKVGFAQVGDDFIHHVSAANMYAKPDHLSEEQFCDFLVDEFENRILQLGPDSVAAFIAEPVMGAGGVYVAPKGYHKRMREVCTRYDVLYIADEVVTAFGRLGEWFSSETVFDCTPDIIVCAKGITSGYIPLGATIFSTEIYDVISRPQCEGGVFSMGLTYFGHPVACAAALKNIEIMGGEGMLDNAKTVGPYLQETARSLLNLPIIGDVRGSHLMLGIDLVDDKQAKTPLPVMENAAERILQKCIQRGVIVRPVGSRLVISPPLIITKEECDTLIGVVSEAIMEFVSERPASQAAE